MESLAPLVLILGGLVLVLVGIASLAGRTLRVGRVPGDLRATKGPFTLYAPLGASLLLSVVLTVVLNLAFCTGPR